MDFKRKMYLQGVAALVASVVVALVVEVCVNYTSAFEQIAETSEIYAS